MVSYCNFLAFLLFSFQYVTSFGTLCPPCGMIYRTIRLPHLWYWPSFVQPESHIHPLLRHSIFLQWKRIHNFQLIKKSLKFYLIILLQYSSYYFSILFNLSGGCIILAQLFNIAKTLLQLFAIFQTNALHVWHFIHIDNIGFFILSTFQRNKKWQWRVNIFATT